MYMPLLEILRLQISGYYQPPYLKRIECKKEHKNAYVE